MAPFGKIYSYPGNFRVQRAQVVAAMNGLEVEVPADFQMEATKKPDFLAKFPMGKIPAFEGADGFCIAEGAAIAMYLAGSGPKAAQLLGGPGELQKRARITEWICFAETELNPQVLPAFVMCVLKYMPYSEAAYNNAANNLERALKRIDQAVDAGAKKFLVGDELTMADIMVAGPLFFGQGFLIDEKMRAAAPGAIKYLDGLAAMPEFQSVFGEIKKCETRVAAP
ncbi:glutathione S-transferase [Apiospora kogelbergensis]|uniref:Glutathione S-transferase n=1 Tax=Apiospora kogelbergensis TaxID=1337665 RepID=A0AAW0REG0_9PEZI